MPRRRHLLAALVALALAACGTPPSSDPKFQGNTAMTVPQIQQALLGDWTSLAPEIRPSAQKNPDGTLKPFYLKREFSYLPQDRFRLVIVNFVDPYGKVPLARIDLRGHVLWRGDHPIAPGAQKVDFVADEAYEVTPLLQGFADVLNRVAATGHAPWQVGGVQSVFGESFAPFGLTEGKNFMEHDLMYLSHDLLFWGARNVDGRGFDTEANRPTHLQIPMARR